MKATAAAVIAFILMFMLGHRPLVRAFGVRTKMWVLLLVDLIVAGAVFLLVW